MRPEEYRRHATECLRIAAVVTDPQNRILLIHMAQAWLRLAHQAEKNLATNIDYEAPPPPGEASRFGRDAATADTTQDRRVGRLIFRICQIVPGKIPKRKLVV